MRRMFAGSVQLESRKGATERLRIVELAPPALAVIPLQQHIRLAKTRIAAARHRRA